MSFPNINPTTTPAWKILQEHFSSMQKKSMKEMFEKDSTRAEDFSLTFKDFYLDYSKNRINRDTLDLLVRLAKEVQLTDAIQAQFNGAKINKTEDRQVLHTDLRNLNNLKSEVKEVHDKIDSFSEAIIHGHKTGYTNKPIRSVVNIGIGGSDLGPKMLTDALSYYKNHLDIHYISNIDGDHITNVLRTLDPETTLVIVVSKSFTTQETIVNANTVKDWFLREAPHKAVAEQFVAVSNNTDEVLKFGISEQNIFPIWEWVGGRFSLWSAVGLSTCLSIGFKNFKELLRGAAEMDDHFRNSEFDKNMPVLMALISIWYNNFFQTETEAIIPYTQYLREFVPYLQQSTMESNGKSVDRNGEKITYQTGTILWGSTGTNAQHAFFQLLHQGTKLVPTDFICFKNDLNRLDKHQQILLSNCFAQTEALMLGVENKDPFKCFDGNKPSNTIMIDKLTPFAMGKLIALYEHKLFVQGVIWNIFSFDQWGVSLGKQVAKSTLKSIKNEAVDNKLNSSTNRLISRVTEK